ncbi:MAG: SLOG family protein [Oscillospiraceae bacterium]
MKSCCFTGHRYIKENQELLNRLKISIEECIHNGITDFYSGGAIGWDTLCSKIMLQLKEKYPHIKLHLILPCNKENQTLYWSKSQVLEYENILKMADTIQYTSNHYYDGCMKVRNARLVEVADLCICYYNHNCRSGTAQTVRMALKKGIPVINFS